jgi:two-component system LytT family sensor kinase
MKRVLQHLLLWTAYVAVEFIANLPHYKDGAELLRQTLFFLPVIALPFYFTAYYLVPRFLWQGRKWLFWLSCTAVLLTVMAIRLKWENWYWLLQTGRDFNLPLSKISKNLFRDYAVIALGVALKIIRDWDTRDRLAQQLQQEKRDAELQFLRAQIHPHFLFNTLNNLYGLALKGSPHTAESILKLSGLLDYILYECNAPFIPVSKELTLIKQYTDMEQLRFGDRLNVTFTGGPIPDGALVAPLLMLPFVENAFKHGAIDPATDKVQVKIDLYIEKGVLHFQVENSTPSGQKKQAKEKTRGLGLRNVEKRLELLYPGRYTLRVLESNGVYLIVLSLQVTPEQ